jgi:hypothetical protein
MGSYSFGQLYSLLPDVTNLGKPSQKTPAAAPAADAKPTTTVDPTEAVLSQVFGPAVKKPEAAVPKNIPIPFNIPLPFKNKLGERMRIKPGLFLSGSRLQGALKGMKDYIDESTYKPNTPGTSFLHGLASGYVGAKGEKAALREKDLAAKKKAWEEDQKNRADFIQKWREAQLKDDKEVPGWTKVTADNIGDINQQLTDTGRNAINANVPYVKTDDLYTPMSQRAEDNNIIHLTTPEEIARFRRLNPDIKIWEQNGEALVPRSELNRQKPVMLSDEGVQFAQGMMASGGTLPGGFMRSPGAARIFNGMKARGFSPAAVVRASESVKANSRSLANLQKMSDNARAFISTAERNAAILDNMLDKIPDTNIRPVNGFVRTVKSWTGDPDVTSYQVALDVVRPEFQRILNSPNMTGSNTVAGAAEMRAVLNNDFTKSQLRTALAVLKADAVNRVSVYDMALQSMRENLPYDPNIRITSEYDNILPDTEPGIYGRQHPTADGGSAGFFSRHGVK